MDALRVVNKVAAKVAPGRLPSFAEAHVIKALEDVGLHRTVGRAKLSEHLHLGEGETRTLIKHLKSEQLIEISQSGISLSVLGKRLLESLQALLCEQADIPSTSLTVGFFNVAVRVVGMKDAVKYGLEQRDAAMMAGAKGATTLVFTKNTLCLPGTGEEVSRIDPRLPIVLSRLGLTNGDVVIIGSADEQIKAEFGAKTAALELLKLKKRRNTRKIS